MAASHGASSREIKQRAHVLDGTVAKAYIGRQMRNICEMLYTTGQEYWSYVAVHLALHLAQRGFVVEYEILPAAATCE